MRAAGAILFVFVALPWAALDVAEGGLRFGAFGGVVLFAGWIAAMLGTAALAGLIRLPR